MDLRGEKRMGVVAVELVFPVVTVRVGVLIGDRRETLMVGGGFCCRRRAGGSEVGRLALFS